MKCYSRSELKRYLVQQMADDEQGHVERHLDACGQCQRVLDSLTEDSLIDDFYQSCRRDDTVRVDRPKAEQKAEPTPSLWQPDMPQGRQFPSRFGRFVLHELLGQGGFGSVYHATDLDLGREVAVKIPHVGKISPVERRRFLREGATAAKLHHPNIVPVFQTGVHDDVCFIVSEYCPGTTLREMLHRRGGTLGCEEAVRILVALTHALEHAHRNGIVHRDIKPTNVILDERSTNFGLEFTPKLIDFGTARIAADDSTLVDGVLIGTLHYLAPEQISGQETDQPAIDLYALGVILYEMIAGRPPIQASDRAQLLHQVLRTEPMALHQVASDVPLDLSAICSQCMEKDPRRRYESALAMGDDLNRFLAGAPTKARPLGPVGRLARWVRRNPQASTMIASIVLLLAVIAVGFAAYSQRLRRINRQLVEVSRRERLAAQRSSAREIEKQKLLYASEIRWAAELYRRGDVKATRDLLARHVPAEGESDLRGIEWSFLDRLTRSPAEVVVEGDGALYCVSVSPDGATFAIAGRSGTIQIHDRLTGERQCVIESEQQEVNDLAFLPTGDAMVSAGDDGSIRWWDPTDGTCIEAHRAHEGKVFGVKFTPDAKHLVSCGTDAVVRLWDAELRTELDSFRDHSGDAESVSISPDGRLLASVGDDGRLVVRDIQTRELIFQWDHSGGSLSSAAFSPDSRTISVAELAGDRRSVKLFDLPTKSLLRGFPHPDGVQCLAFASDGGRLLTFDRLGGARLWETSVDPLDPVGAPQPLGRWQAHPTRVYAVTMEPEGNSLLSVGDDGTVRRWRLGQLVRTRVLDFSALPSVPGPQDNTVPGPHDNTFYSLAFASGNQGRNLELLVSGLRGLTRIRLDKHETPQLIESPTQQPMFVVAHGRGNGFATVTCADVSQIESGLRVPVKIRQWHPDGNRAEILVETDGSSTVNDLSSSADGDRLAVLLHHFSNPEDQKELVLLDADTGKIRQRLAAGAGSKSRFSPDGRWWICAIRNDVVLIDLETDRRRVRRGVHADAQNGLAVSRDGRWFATCDESRLIHLWSADGLQLHAALRGHLALVTGMVFSHDSRTLISSSADGTVKAWSVSAGQELMNLHACKQKIDDMAISEDGNQLAILLAGRQVQLIDLR